MKPPVEISFSKILETESFQEFMNATRNYCFLIETHQSDNERKFLEIVQKQILKLYTLGFQLPEIKLSTDIDFDIDIPDTDLRNILKFIAERVPFSYYWAVLNPVDEANLPETGTGDLVDDLGDIYHDLKRGLILFDKNDIAAKEEAVWLFKFQYDTHWNEHCIEALNAIHHYFQENRL